MTPAGIKELKATLDELREKYSNLSADDLFVLWFLRAYLMPHQSPLITFSLPHRRPAKNADCANQDHSPLQSIDPINYFYNGDYQGL